MPDDAATEDDERYLMIEGRRWRRTDPAVPEQLRAQLVAVLMAGRRAVGAAKRSGASGTDTDEAMTAARRQVHDAKVALGERGEPWWDEPSPEGFADRVSATVMSLLRGRDDDATICPSEAARAVGGAGWREQMDGVRATAAELVESGVVTVLRGGLEVDPGSSGPIRIGRGPTFDRGRPS